MHSKKGHFALLLAIFTAIGASLAIISGNLFGAKWYYVQLIMWSPAAAATICADRFRLSNAVRRKKLPYLQPPRQVRRSEVESNRQERPSLSR